MRKIAVFLLPILLAGCGLKVEHPAEELVTEVEMPAGERFTPGDEVTVRAVGFEATDEIWFDIAWTDGTEDFAPNGTARGLRGTVTGRTDTSISFLVPGHYPPATVTVLLFRSGSFQTLGTIRTGDGVQHETMLYTFAATLFGGSSVACCPMSGSADLREEVLTTDLPLECVVGSIGNGIACGVMDGRLVELDLITRQVQELGEDCLLVGAASESTVAGLFVRDDRLCLSDGSLPYAWRLPEGVTPDRIVRQPFAFAFNALLLAVRNDDGTLSPLVLPLSGTRALLGPAVDSRTLLPYWMLRPAADNPSKWERVGGYAVLHDDLTWFQPLDPATLSLAPTRGEADLVVEGRVLSMTQCRLPAEAGDADPQPAVRIGVLTDTDGRREAWIYNPSTRSGSRVLDDVDLFAVQGLFFAR